MSNLVLTAKNAPGVTAKLVAAHLKEKAKFIKSISKETDQTFADSYKSASPGDTVYVKKPTRYPVGSSLDITSTMSDIQQEKVALTLDKLANVAFKMTSLETAYDKPIKYWNDEFVEPAMNALAADMDKWALNKACLATYALSGTAGTPSGQISQFLAAGQKLYEQIVPEDDEIYAMINPSTNTVTVDARKGLFNRSSTISENYGNGYITSGEGMNYMRSNLLPTFTSGTASGAHTVTTTISSGGVSTIAVTGTGTQTITAGTVITVAGVYDVHPLTKQAYGNLKQFVVTSSATAVASSYTLSVSPTIYGSSSGALQNVSALPTASSAVTIWNGTLSSTNFQQNLVYHKNAFRFVSVPLYTPKDSSLDFVASESKDGFNVRVLRGFDIRTSESIMRFDILAGLAAVRPEWACRAAG